MNRAALIERIVSHEGEIWKPIARFPGYEISSLGRVRSTIPRKGARAKVRGGVMNLSKQFDHNGRRVKLTATFRRDGKTYRAIVHHLVLRAFFGDRPFGTEACHNDGNPFNNCVTNLRWDTHASNVQDAIRHGTFSKPPVHLGERHHNTKLTAADVRTIRTTPIRRGTKAALARQFGITTMSVSRIIRRDVWDHVP